MRRVVKSRANRAKFVPADLLADPAWDILLDLYSAGLSQHRISVSSLCQASNVPASTGLRWIKMLECEGFIERHGDPFDGRRYFMELTDAGLKAMDGYFTSEAASHKSPAVA